MPRGGHADVPGDGRLHYYIGQSVFVECKPSVLVEKKYPDYI